MEIGRIFGMGVSLALVTALSGCLGSSGGGTAAGAAGGSSGFEAAFNAASGLGPTTDMPTSLNANYTGQMKVGVNSGASNLLGSAINPSNAEIIGDVDINVAWTNGGGGNPFTGTANNFVATEAGTSNSVALTGSLTVDAGLPQSIARTTIPAMVVAGQNIPAQDTGSFTFNMTGQLSGNGETANTSLMMGGTFFGSGAAAMVGPVVGGVKDVNSTSAALFDAGVGGTFYATQ